MGWTRRWSKRLRALLRKEAVERELDEELALHLELETEKNLRAGMAAEEARRQAALAFGGVEKHKEEVRDARVLGWVPGMSLDLKLGLRMLAKYPGLSLVAVIGMAVAIAIGAGWFAAMNTMLDSDLPLDEGDRIVSLRNWNTRTNDADRQSAHDFVLWRDELASVENLGAFRTDSRNLITDDGSVELVQIAEMTASGFRVARVAPTLGRPLVDEDEREGAPPVMAIAHEEWRRRFGGDPDIVGRTVRLGETVYTVVGVMPEGFRFPINHHYWVPLRLNLSSYERGGGPSIDIFGRLADGVSLARASAELATIGRRTAGAFPDTHEQLRPEILPYTYPFLGIDSPAESLTIRLFQLFVSLLLVVVAVNVAVLVYARTVTRAGEIAVRTALGASRRRVVTQLFAEALVLSLVAAAVGLAIAGQGLSVMNAFLARAPGDFPFWIHFAISPGVVLYVAGLAIVASAIVGILPALKATGRHVQAGLQQLSSRGSQMQLGRTWTVLIVAQVAIAVAVLPNAIYFATMSVLYGAGEPGYPADEFLRAQLSMESEEVPAPAHTAAYGRGLEARFADRTGELLRRLEAEPAVSGVTFASSYPGSEGAARMEVEGSRASTESTAGPAVLEQSLSHWVRINQVDVDLFKVFDISILAGRGFVAGDSHEGSTAVIVNQVFAERIGGGDILGRRVRNVGTNGDAMPEEMEKGPWYEIVGVVPDFPIPPFTNTPVPKLYRPVALARLPTFTLALRIHGGAAATYTKRLVEITAAVDPALQLRELRSVAEAARQARDSMRYLALMIVAVILSVLLLSTAGIYAMMSFTVARRRREIGIRAALGGHPRQILQSILSRALGQVTLGVVVGLAASFLLDRLTAGDLLGGKAALLLPIVTVLMLVVGTLAVLGPARRGLRVQPMDALREE